MSRIDCRRPFFNCYHCCPLIALILFGVFIFDSVLWKLCKVLWYIGKQVSNEGFFGDHFGRADQLVTVVD